MFGQNTYEPRVELLGEVKQGKYQNSVFGFEFNVPTGWYVANPENADTIKRFAKEGVKDYKIPNTANTVPEIISLMITRDALGAVKNAVLGFSVTKQSSSKITATMLAEATRPLFVGKNGTSLNKDIASEVIGGKTFATFEMLVAGLGKQYVRIYITMIGENAITFVLTYWEDQDRDRSVLGSSIKSIRFTK